jgi:4-hydroxy-tetrahydrodipicolinate synthase
VMALPPLARDTNGRLAAEPNRAIRDWLASAGVTTFMYGGVANFFNASLAEYDETLDLIESLAGAEDWVIPSIGPDFGKASDQVAVLRGRAFPTAMVLPMSPVTHAGVATGLRRLSDALGRPLMIFFKGADFIAPRDLATLIADGVVCTAEYGIVGPPGATEPFLAELLAATGDARWIIDGQGERTVVGNARHGLVGFTTGSGIVGPHLSMALLRALRESDLTTAAALREHFLPLERLRQEGSPIPVLHDAVRLAGIADTGPIGPFFANVTDPGLVGAITQAALALKAASLARG